MHKKIRAHTRQDIIWLKETSEEYKALEKVILDKKYPKRYAMAHSF